MNSTAFSRTSKNKVLLWAVCTGILLAACNPYLASDITPSPGAVLPASFQPAPVMAQVSYTTNSVQQASSPSAPVETAQATAAPEAGAVTVSGKINNGSGGSLPAALPVTLEIYDGMSVSSTLTTTSQPDGSYRFDNIPFVANRVFLVEVAYLDLLFYSDPSEALAEPGQQITLPVNIYEVSYDPSPLIVDRMHIFIDFSTANTLQIGELFIISNPTNKVIAASQPGQALLNFNLPAGATNLQLDSGSLGDRFVQTANGFGDTQGIQPGSGTHQVLFAYDLAYSGQCSLPLALPLPVEAVVVMAPAADGVTVQSDQLISSGSRSLEGGGAVQIFTGGSLSADTPLRITISGQPAAAGSSSGSQATLLISLCIFLLAVGVVLYFFLGEQNRRKKAALVAPSGARGASQVESEEALLDAIIALDDLYQGGKLTEDVYQRRREDLKERLLDLHSKSK